MSTCMSISRRFSTTQQSKVHLSSENMNKSSERNFFEHFNYVNRLIWRRQLNEQGKETIHKFINYTMIDFSLNVSCSIEVSFVIFRLRKFMK